MNREEEGWGLEPVMSGQLPPLKPLRNTCKALLSFLFSCPPAKCLLFFDISMNEGKKLFLRQDLSLQPWLSWNIEIHMLGLKVCAPMPGLKNKTNQTILYILCNWWFQGRGMRCSCEAIQGHSHLQQWSPSQHSRLGRSQGQTIPWLTGVLIIWN